MKRLLAALESAHAAGTLRDLDLHLARHLLALDAGATPIVGLAIAALSRANADGDVCLDLAQLAGTRLLTGADTRGGIAAPALPEWRAALLASALVGTPATATLRPAPLILDASDRLYLQKYFVAEQRVAADITARLAAPPAVDETALRAALAACFAGRADDDAQRIAAATAAHHRFCVITGGPGTGKTTTVARLLAVLLLLAGDAPPRIALAAPTGKAAARLGDALRAALLPLQAHGIDATLLARIPPTATTLHRLLGQAPGQGFRHHSGNPLPLDLLVVDEASMIDLPLTARLVDALPAHARLLLLGDQDQLASVEAGSVLGDICNHGEPGRAAIGQAIARLHHSHRFGDDSGIGALARAIRAGDRVALRRALAGASIEHHALAAGNVAATVARETATHFAALHATDDPVAALQAFNRFRFLCALREGPFGVAQVNRLAEQELARLGLIDAGQRHYRGRPLLVTENAAALDLYNGDTGLVLPDAQGRLQACFLSGDGTLRRVALNRLPAHATCYAMTVHKSQGSEFDRVALLLPEADNPVLGRELLYTAVTRARREVALYAAMPILELAISRRVQRSSGLRDALWHHAEN